MNEKTKPRIMTGFMELLPPDQIMFNKIYDTIRSVYESFGFLPLDTPVLELAEVLLAKAGGETEKQIYRFNKGDTDIAMRFDLTVPLARYVAQHAGELTFPFKRYQMSKVYRGERPQNGRFREFYQCDIDIIGNEELPLIHDAEIPAVIYNIFKKLDFGKFTVRLNNRKVLNGFFSELGLADNVADILRVIDKIDKIGAEKVLAELAEYGADGEKGEKILAFITASGSTDEKIAYLKSLNIENENFKEGTSELEQVAGYMRMFGIDDDYFTIDLTIARGLDYYTGTVYETVLDDYRNLGSVCSGGRYDNLTGYYTKQKMPGIGISIGLTRLFSQLKNAELIKPESNTVVKALVAPMGIDMKYPLEIAEKLRSAGVPTEVYYQDKGFKHKMKYANKMGIPYVVIIGEDELKDGNVTVKNMETGEQKTVKTEEIVNEIK
ncbi:MAG: histidine--tRNA ligase [Firmicutes bacterium]|nr:histidine--tRNA ligase [Bacillota bacterium]MBQ9604412.1 histidine--tRNA ligase [Bacillota bacterium]